MSTLHSLSANGGIVAAMDLVIIKVRFGMLQGMYTYQNCVKTHPIAFIQFVEGQDGQKHREGPWNEEDENRVNEQWKVDSIFF